MQQQQDIYCLKPGSVSKYLALMHCLLLSTLRMHAYEQTTVSTQIPYNIMRSKRQFKLTVFAIMIYTSFFAASQRRLSPIIVTTTTCYWE